MVIVIGLALVMMSSGSGHLENLTSRGIAAGSSHYWAVGGGLMAGMIMGLTTLVGFDSAANLGEEAKDPFRTVPRAIVGSVVAAGVAGLLFLIALTVAIKDVTAVSNSGSPVGAIYFAKMMIFNREVLDAQPGAGTVAAELEEAK